MAARRSRRSRCSPASSAAARRRCSNRVLRDPRFADTAVLVNELGEIPIDHALVREASEDVVVLPAAASAAASPATSCGRCASCISSAPRATVPHFPPRRDRDHGLADPAPAARDAGRDAAGRRALLARGRGHRGGARARRARRSTSIAEAVKQVAMADRLVVTKCDLRAAADDRRARGAPARAQPARDAGARRRGRTRSRAGSSRPACTAHGRARRRRGLARRRRRDAAQRRRRGPATTRAIRSFAWTTRRQPRRLGRPRDRAGDAARRCAASASCA